MKLVTKYRISAINSCWEKCAYMFNVYKNQLSWQTGSWNLTGYTHLTYICICTFFRRIFLSNYWWQESDIWSQASYRYPILWEAFLDPSDSNFLFANLVEHICKFFSKMCIYKCMLNVYKNQQNRQTGSRNLMGSKTFPTIWDTYMKLVTKYQISAVIISDTRVEPLD
jgi:hypothetical protein